MIHIEFSSDCRWGRWADFVMAELDASVGATIPVCGCGIDPCHPICPPDYETTIMITITE